jgi:hypothetical protein
MMTVCSKKQKGETSERLSFLITIVVVQKVTMNY